MKRRLVVSAVLLAAVGVLVLSLRRAEPGRPAAPTGAGAATPDGGGARGNLLPSAAGEARGPAPAAVRPPRDAQRPAGTLLEVPWGSGRGRLGRARPSEANPEAPASFTLDASGRLLVLDKVNGRIVRYDPSGKELDPIPVTQRSPQELLATPDGSLLVMDRLADRTVAILDEDGTLQGELPVVGKGLEQGGSATGLFQDRDGVYVENEHSQVVRIGDLAGVPDQARPVLDGRPSRDGRSLLSARLLDRAQGRMWIRVVDRASGSLRHQKQLTLGTHTLAIVFLDSDARGGIYLGAHVGQEVQPGRMVGEAVQVVCLSSGGEVRGTAVLPANTGPEESFRDLAVRDDGTLVHMERTDAGVAIRTYRCG